MSENAITRPAQSVKTYFQQDAVRAKFAELMGKKATGFITSLMSVVQNNDYLKKAQPESIYMSAMMAAALDLPINPNFGFAYIIPYKDQAQFQIGYRGIIQLALRSGQFKTISSCPIYEGQLIAENPLTGYSFDFKKKASDTIIGYAAYFSLLNGFEKTDFKTVAEVQAHGKKYSKTFSNGPWKTDFDSMAQKTVLKLLLAKYAPLSVEMQKAIIADQAVIKDVETMEMDYVDEGQAVIDFNDLCELYELKKDQLTEEEIKDADRILSNKETLSYKKLQNILQSK